MNKGWIYMVNNASDVLLHSKDSDKTERIIFPITRQQNIIGMPTIISSDKTIVDSNGAAFLLLQTDTVSIDEDELNAITNYRLIGE